MANQCFIFRKGGDITTSEVIEAFNRINDDFFYSLLTLEITKYDNYDRLIIMLDKSGYHGVEINIDERYNDLLDDGTRVIAGKYLNIVHGHHFKFYWWLDKIFTYHFLKIFNADGFDEGIGEIDKNKYKCPPISFQEYLTKVVYETNELEELEKILEPKVYHMLISEKLKKRNHQLDLILNETEQK